METTATLKGQIVIPAEMRRKLKIKEGTRIHVELDEENQQLILTPITREYIHSLRGKYKGLGLLQTLMEDKQREREL
jgi:AbrB family looped-hinge helix DNA binding protein